jgi:ribonuclease VapC
LIVVDASALVAIAAYEPEHLSFLQAIDRSDTATIGEVNYLEAGMVLISRGYFTTSAGLDAWLAELAIERWQDGGLSDLALSAFMAFGKGRHPARLNLGDCFAYALAKQLDAPLLYKGDDFTKTDIRSALQPM